MAATNTATCQEGSLTEKENIDFGSYIRSRSVNSWTRQLSRETPENLLKSCRVEGLNVDQQENRNRRPVFNGHYVSVLPTPLPAPVRLVLVSPQTAQLLQIPQSYWNQDDFVAWVAGNLNVAGDEQFLPWATPYALSIMGTRYTSNCPYGTGNGYGDGRAISLAELATTNDNLPADYTVENSRSFSGYEIQLKGCGTTPFCRGGDGRAVLRSSMREFLASEAMFALGIATTRALSLVVSDFTVQRPWYRDNTQLSIPSMNDTRLAKYSSEQKEKIIAQIRQQKLDPDVMQSERAAITARVAPSFARIGHVDLFYRRIQQEMAAAGQETYQTQTLAWREYQDMIWHAAYREYRAVAHDPFVKAQDAASMARALLQQSAETISTMVAHWIRVGFIQGNFNADNCLIGGRTMDYGPFGWLEEYHPVAAKWTGSGEHFGFLNQVRAAYVNYQILVTSVAPLIAVSENSQATPDDVVKLSQELLDQAQPLFQNKLDQTFRIKLGYPADADVGDNVWEHLEPLLLKSRTDWTLFFRQLSEIVRQYPDFSSTDYEGMLRLLTGEDGGTGLGNPAMDPVCVFYEPLTNDRRDEWLVWVEEWRTVLGALMDSNGSDSEESGRIHSQMIRANPKYVLREWMMVEAYNKGEENDFDGIHELFKLIQHPYAEGTATQQATFYRRAPDEALTAAGTAFFSCSS
jgi:serine/tyrosine/threonine adenylyltransferase